MQAIDIALFRLINQSWANSLFDRIMPTISNVRAFWLPIVLLMVLVAALGGRKGRVLVLTCIAAVAVTDLFSSHLVRDFFGRERPCWCVEGVRLLVSCKKSLAFPSSHASNIGACAVLVSLYYPKWRIPAALVAFLVGYSRIYLGVHYPFDVLGGWMLGSSLAAVLYSLSLHVLEPRSNRG